MEAAIQAVGQVSSMKRSRTLKLTLSLLLAAAAVAFGGLSFYRKVQSFQPLGFVARMEASGAARVVAVDDPRTGLIAGDQLFLATLPEAGTEADLVHVLKSQPESRIAVLRGDQVIKVLYHRPPLAIDFPYLLVALIGVGYLLIGLYTLLKHGERPGFLFYLWCLASAVFYLLSAVPPADLLYRIVFTGDELARIFLPALTLHLFLVFPAPPEEADATVVRTVYRRYRRWTPFLYLPAAVLLALQLDLALGLHRLFVHPTAAAIVTLDHLEVYHLMVYALAAVGLLAWRIGHGRTWEQQRQLQWVAFGLAGGYLPFFLLYVVPLALGLHRPQLLTVLAVLPLGLVPVAFAYSILRYKLWDIEIIVRDTISATLTLLLGIIGFSLVNLAILRGVPQDLSLTRNLLSFAAGLAIAGLLVPTRRSISGTLERFHYRRSFGKRRALSDLGQELLHERDLGRLCSALLRQIEEGVEIERANLYLVQGGTLYPVRSEPGLPERLSPEALGDGLWEENYLYLSGVSLSTEPTAPAQRLFIGGYRYAFPLAVLGSRVGIVLTGYKKDRDPLNSEDVELIRHLLNQAALAIENAQLLGQLHQQLDEVLRLKRYNEGIFESSPAGIAVLDPAGRVVSVNAAFVQLAGRERAALLGRPLAASLPVQPLPRPGEAPVEVSYCDPTGRERYLQLSLADFAGTGEATGAGGLGENLSVLVVHDVSERVAMEHALQEKDRLAALGMLAAGVAHEVNTPITGISSYAQMLLSETAENDPHYDILKKVERQTFRAARIVNNLLEFAKNRQNERRPVALAPLITESLDLMGDRPGRRRIEVDWQPPSLDLPEIRVFGCDGELQQVLTNLLLNALQAMAEQGGRLTVRLEADAANARVHVDDTGPGIPAERLARIFEPFYSTKLASGGTGLGLAISYDIVRRHGGSLAAASEPGRGTRFTVELPRLARPL